MVKKCCVCRMVKCKDKWDRPKDSFKDEQVSHGYCPSCFVDAMARIVDHSQLRSAGLNRMDMKFEYGN